MKKTFLLLALILCFVAMLTSCGGGVGESGGTTASYYANWTCGTSTQCVSVMGAASGSQGPFSALSACESWCDTYIPGACSCSSTAGGGGGGATYTVTYNGNGATSGFVPVDSTGYKQAQTVTVLGAGTIVKTGYFFSGWNRNSYGSGTNYTQGQTFAMGSANVVLYAKWTSTATYRVTYNGNGNTGGSDPTDSTNYLQGQTATLLGPGNLVKTGYYFSGWNTTSNGYGSNYTASQSVVMGPANLVLYAKWTTNPTYTVTYNGNGNTGGSVPIDPTSYEQGSTVTVPGNTGNLVKTGYFFSGWNTLANGSGSSYTQGQTFAMGSANTTLYAKWAPTYTVTYNGNGNTGGSVPVDSTGYEQGQTVTVLGNTGNLVKAGSSFSGWNTLANGSGTSYTQGQTFAIGAANVTLYAKWTINPTYTVTYNGNGAAGGSVPIDSTGYEQGQTVTVLGNTGNLVATTYSFSGWNTQADGSGTNYGQGQTFTMGAVNVTLYAKWTIYVPSFAYAANAISNDISQYTIGANGALTPMTPATVPAGTYPTSVAVGPSGRYAYVTNDVSNTVSQYSINVNGTLTAMTPATIAAGTNPYSVIIDPAGKYAYVANAGSANVSQYTIDADGKLTSMTPATVAAGVGPISITVDFSGKYAYTANSGNNNVSQYTIGVNGALSPMTPAIVAAGPYPTSVTIDPSGKYAYVTNGNSYTVSQYTIGADGALTPMTPATTDAELEPRSLTVHPSGKYAYVTNASGYSNNVSQYAIGADGALTPMNPSTVAAGAAPLSLSIDPSGKYAYVANRVDNNISQYTIGGTGALSRMTPITVGAGTNPYSITTVGSQ